jgi:hypothetical protein
MSVIAWKDGPVFRDGAVGTGTECCCGGGGIQHCLCSGSPITVPSSITLEFTLGSLFGATGTCAHADATGFVEGTYIMGYVSGTTTEVNYSVTAANGLVAGLTWYCSSIYGPFGSTIGWGLGGYCDGSETCFARVLNAFYLGPIGSSFTSKKEALCDLTLGSTTPFTYTGPGIISLEQGPLTCGVIGNAGVREYNISATFTPAW